MARHLPGKFGRDPLRHPMLVLLCHERRPMPAPPCRGIPRRKRLRLISNLPPLCERVPCCFATCLVHLRCPRMFGLVYFLLPLVISSWFSFATIRVLC